MQRFLQMNVFYIAKRDFRLGDCDRLVYKSLEGTRRIKTGVISMSWTLTHVEI